MSTVDYQPIALEDVVDYVVRFSLEEPKNKIVEIAGPDGGLMTDFVEGYLREKGADIIVIANDNDKYMFEDIPRSLLVPSGEFFPGKIRFSDWVKNNKHTFFQLCLIKRRHDLIVYRYEGPAQRDF
ncbi:hypothetical protein LWM68_25335 [Niabella sp. W65]|nr:hypothetical protein [Niabella sp. W65]MCH7365792.1 hypothetical protein [Niabella sp. W65]